MTVRTFSSITYPDASSFCERSIDEENIHQLHRKSPSAARCSTRYECFLTDFLSKKTHSFLWDLSTRSFSETFDPKSKDAAYRAADGPVGTDRPQELNPPAMD